MKSPKADELSLTEEPLRDKRRQGGLQAAIDILNQKHANGELNDWNDFEQCMNKAEIITLIRANPADYPYCNKIKSNQSQAMIKRKRSRTESRRSPRAFQTLGKTQPFWLSTKG